jgi:geranylgeranyl reductase family protein
VNENKLALAMDSEAVAEGPVAWQGAPNAVPREGWEALVVGAGPAGSVTALHLARQGHRVLLLDRDRFPRDKVCGDLLIADALQAVDQVGLTEDVRAASHEVEGFSIFSPSRVHFELPGRYRTLPRWRFDALLAGAAVAAGATFCQAQVEDVTCEAGGRVACRVAGVPGPFRARFSVLATGAGVDLLRRLGWPVQGRASAMAARLYVRSALCVERLVVSFDRAINPGYAWIFPLGGGLYNVGCGAPGPGGTNLRQMFRRFVADFPLAAELFCLGEAVSPLCGARLRCGLPDAAASVAGNLVAVGETIGSTYPLTGEGVGKAMRTGELAAEAIHEALVADDPGRLRAYPARLEAELRPYYDGYARAERWLNRPWFHDLLSWRVRRSRFLRDRVAAVLDERLDAAAVCSAGVLLRSLFL